MPIHASDIILDWIAKDGYSLSETRWIQALDASLTIAYGRNGDNMLPPDA